MEKAAAEEKHCTINVLIVQLTAYQRTQSL